MTYIEKFIEKNKNKSFVSNLMKYSELNYHGKAKVISSFLTHLLISAELGDENESYQIEVMSILNSYILYKQDRFLEWLKNA
jgi:plasmid replication initiation protein